MKRKESGLTLLSLVVAVVVMLILAGIAIRLGIGENGLISRTMNTVDKYQNTSEIEQAQLNEFVDDFNEILNGEIGTGEEDTSIKDRPNITISDWNEDGGLVEISTSPGLDTQYRIENGEWQDYTGDPVPVKNGETIYARYEDSSDEDNIKHSGNSSLIVRDTEPPVVVAEITETKRDSITVHATATDEEMGMPSPVVYNFYIKKSTDNFYEYIGQSTDGNFKYEDLEPLTDYDIRVTAKDLAGNEGQTTETQKTEPPVPPVEIGKNIFFELDPDYLTNTNVNVTITTNAEDIYWLEFSVNGEDDYKTYIDPVVMEQNGRVYARLTDGTSYSANSVYIDVTNIDKRKPIVDMEVTDVQSDRITVEVTADEEDVTYDYYIKKKGEDDSQYKHEEGGTSNTHTFEGLEDGEEYEIYVVVTDKAGNQTEEHLTEAVRTDEIPAGNEDGNIVISGEPVRPTNGNVTVSIVDNTNLGYTLQYSVDDGEYKDYTGEFEVDHNCTVQARLTDGTNYGAAASLAITNIDKEKPTIEADPPQDENYSQEKTITINATDPGTAKFKANQTLKYAFSTSNSQVPSSFKSLNGTNAESAPTLTFTIPNEDLTGTYYLWIQAGSLQDRAENSNDVKVFGPYHYDNTAPTPTFEPDSSTEYNKEYEIKVDVTDDNGDVTDIKYQWTQGDTPPDPDSFTEDFDNGDTIKSPDGATGDDWHLWIKAEDENGNESIIGAGPFYLDNTAPTVDFGENGNTNWSNEHSTTVTVGDPNSGVDEGSLKYQWVQGDGTPTEDTFTNSFNNGDEIKSPDNVTGDDWHLWILAKDELGNTVIIGSDPFYLDNSNPTVIFNPNGKSSWSKTQNSTVTVNDQGAGVNASSLKYQWTQSTEQPAENTFTTPFTNGGTISKNDGTGNNWHLWILAKDNIGNTLIQRSNAFWLDNTVPTLTLSNTGTTSSITVTATASDSQSGVNNSTYRYYIKEVNGNYGSAVSDGNTHTFNGLKQNTTYIIRVEVTDNVGNTVAKETGNITTGTVPEGSTSIDYKLNPNTWTNGNVTVTLSKNSSLQSPNNYTLQYRIGTGGTWTNYTAPLVRSDNTTIYARLIDAAGNFGGNKTITFTWIDKNIPTLSAEPTTQNTASQTVSVVVTGSDTGTSGFAANQSLEYAWSTSNTDAPTEYESITGTNAAGATSAKFTVPGRDLTGTYYLWIQAGSLQDRAGNKTAVAHYGPYSFDNTAPTPSFGTNGSTTWSKSHSTTVTAPDATEQLQKITEQEIIGIYGYMQKTVQEMYQ